MLSVFSFVRWFSIQIILLLAELFALFLIWNVTADYMRTTCRQHADDMQTTCGRHVDNMWTTCRQHKKCGIKWELMGMFSGCHPRSRPHASGQHLSSACYLHVIGMLPDDIKRQLCIKPTDFLVGCNSCQYRSESQEKSTGYGNTMKNIDNIYFQTSKFWVS